MYETKLMINLLIQKKSFKFTLGRIIHFHKKIPLKHACMYQMSRNHKSFCSDRSMPNVGNRIQTSSSWHNPLMKLCRYKSVAMGLKFRIGSSYF